MATNLDAPTFDTGLVDVDQVLTVVSTEDTLYLYGFHFANDTDDPITILLTNTAGKLICPTKQVPPHDFINDGFALLPCVGLKWQASAPGLDGQIWGYTSWPL